MTKMLWFLLPALFGLVFSCCHSAATLKHEPVLDYDEKPPETPNEKLALPPNLELIEVPEFSFVLRVKITDLPSTPTTTKIIRQQAEIILDQAVQILIEKTAQLYPRALLVYVQHTQLRFDLEKNSRGQAASFLYQLRVFIVQPGSWPTKKNLNLICSSSRRQGASGIFLKKMTHSVFLNTQTGRAIILRRCNSCKACNHSSAFFCRLYCWAQHYIGAADREWTYHFGYWPSETSPVPIIGRRWPGRYTNHAGLPQDRDFLGLLRLQLCHRDAPGSSLTGKLFFSFLLAPLLALGGFTLVRSRTTGKPTMTAAAVASVFAVGWKVNRVHLTCPFIN